MKIKPNTPGRKSLIAPFEKTRRVLMCPPRHYCIKYEINAWMNDSRARFGGKKDPVDRKKAHTQWYALVDELNRVGIKTSIMKAAPGLPDLVFTANAGFVYNGKIVLSNFRHKERAREQRHFSEYFSSETNLKFVTLPMWGKSKERKSGGIRLYFEGHGDALFFKNTLFCGCGERSNEEGIREAIRHSGFIGKYSILQLVDPYFYHLDTCFCPVGDFILYYPQAFSKESQEEIKRVAGEKGATLIAVSKQDAMNFVCNGIPVKNGKKCGLITSRPSPALCDILHEAQISVSVVDVSEFIKAGGGARCLVLFF